MSSVESSVGFVHVQSQSALFAVIPAEVRAEIFSYVVLAYDDLSRPYREDRFYYRPGHHFHKRIDTSLLHTCKRIYNEAKLLPLAVNVHTFWLFRGPPPRSPRPPPGTSWIPSVPHNAAWTRFLNSLTVMQRPSVKTIQIFVQQAFLENICTTIHHRHEPPEHPQFQLSNLRGIKHLHLTFRFQDWWSWESPPESPSDRMGICPWVPGRVNCTRMLAEPVEPDLEYLKTGMWGSRSLTDDSSLSTEDKHLLGTGVYQGTGTWGAQICLLGSSLRRLTLDFESCVPKRDQLDVIVERAKHWRFPLIPMQSDSATPNLDADDGNITVLESCPEKTRKYRWVGLQDVKEEPRYHHPGGRFADLRESPVVKDGPKREYLVMTMVWEARSLGLSN